MNSTDGESGRLLDTNSIPFDASTLIALSGGMDSVYLCLRLSSDGELDHRRVGAIHVDHGIRPTEQSREDRFFVEGLCERLNIPLRIVTYKHGQLSAKAEEEHRSLEEVAREARYAAFESVRLEEGYDYVLLGHHASDQDETVIMRFLEGAGPFGLRGMPERRDHFLRPLMRMSRNQIAAAMGDEPYRRDSTNDDLSFLRNRVRNELVPLLDREFAGYRSALEVFREKQSDIANLVDSMLRDVHWQATNEGYTLEAEVFWSMPSAIRVESCTRMWARASGECRIPYRFFRAVRNLERRRAGTILRGHGGILEASGNHILWRHDVVQKDEKRYCIHVTKDSEYDLGFCRVRTGERAHNATEVRFEAANGPLILRSRGPGDVIAGRNGRKSVKHMLNEWKVPERERWKVPILADRQGVIAVLGKCFGGRDRYRYIEGSTDSAIALELILRESTGWNERRQER